MLFYFSQIKIYLGCAGSAIDAAFLHRLVVVVEVVVVIWKTKTQNPIKKYWVNKWKIYEPIFVFMFISCILNNIQKHPLPRFGTLSSSHTSIPYTSIRLILNLFRFFFVKKIFFISVTFHGLDWIGLNTARYSPAPRNKKGVIFCIRGNHLETFC